MRGKKVEEMKLMQEAKANYGPGIFSAVLAGLQRGR